MRTLSVFMVVLALATGRAWGDQAEGHYKAGMALKADGKDDEAIKELEKAVKARPTHAMAWNSLGILYKKMGKFKDAVRAFEEAAKLLPKNAAVLSNLGMAYWRDGERLDEAIGALEKSCRIDPKNA